MKKVLAGILAGIVIFGSRSPLFASSTMDYTADTDTEDTEITGEAVELTLNETVHVELEKGDYACFTYTPTETGYYEFFSSNNSCAVETDGDTITDICDPFAYIEWTADDLSESGFDDNDKDENGNFAIRRKLEAGVTYYFKVYTYETMDLVCDVSFDVTLTTYELNEDKQISSVSIDITETTFDTLDEAELAGTAVVTYEDGSTWEIILEDNYYYDEDEYGNKIVAEINNSLKIDSDGDLVYNAYVLSFAYDVLDEITEGNRVYLDVKEKLPVTAIEDTDKAYIAEIYRDGSLYYSFTPDVSGLYSMDAKIVDSYAYLYYTEDEYSLSYYVADVIYSLEDGENGIGHAYSDDGCYLEAGVTYYIDTYYYEYLYYDMDHITSTVSITVSTSESEGTEPGDIEETADPDASDDPDTSDNSKTANNAEALTKESTAEDDTALSSDNSDDNDGLSEKDTGDAEDRTAAKVMLLCICAAGMLVKAGKLRAADVPVCKYLL